MTNFVNSHYSLRGLAIEGKVVDSASPDLNEKRTFEIHVLKLLNLLPIGREPHGKAKHITRDGKTAHKDQHAIAIPPPQLKRPFVELPTLVGNSPPVYQLLTVAIAQLPLLIAPPSILPSTLEPSAIIVALVLRSILVALIRLSVLRVPPIVVL